MTNQHPITPPPELVQQWAYQRKYLSDQVVFSEIAQWGADQELEACVDFVQYEADWNTAEKLRDTRRPKAPSLKEQALADFDWLVGRTLGRPEFDERSERIRRALEQLPE